MLTDDARSHRQIPTRDNIVCLVLLMRCDPDLGISFKLCNGSLAGHSLTTLCSSTVGDLPGWKCIVNLLFQIRVMAVKLKISMGMKRTVLMKVRKRGTMSEDPTDRSYSDLSCG
jgi:hypothetical protein